MIECSIPKISFIRVTDKSGVRPSDHYNGFFFAHCKKEGTHPKQTKPNPLVTTKFGLEGKKRERVQKINFSKRRKKATTAAGGTAEKK